MTNKAYNNWAGSLSFHSMADVDIFGLYLKIQRIGRRIPRPEMIPKLDRKWSRTANDPRCGPQMIEFGFPDFFKFLYLFIYLFIHFHQLNDELDEHSENIFRQRKL